MNNQNPNFPEPKTAEQKKATRSPAPHYFLGGLAAIAFYICFPYYLPSSLTGKQWTDTLIDVIGLSGLIAAIYAARVFAKKGKSLQRPYSLMISGLIVSCCGGVLGRNDQRTFSADECPTAHLGRVENCRGWAEGTRILPIPDRGFALVGSGPVEKKFCSSLSAKPNDVRFEGDQYFLVSCHEWTPKKAYICYERRKENVTPSRRILVVNFTCDRGALLSAGQTSGLARLAFLLKTYQTEILP